MTAAPDPVPVALARIEGKLDGALAGVSDHEDRIRKLEARQWPLPSAALLASLAALVVPYVVR